MRLRRNRCHIGMITNVMAYLGKFKHALIFITTDQRSYSSLKEKYRHVLRAALLHTIQEDTLEQHFQEVLAQLLRGHASISCWHASLLVTNERELCELH